MNLNPRNIQKGFTIVELLIVIVVIGVLAAITVVAFSGAKDSAYDAKRGAGIAAYVKAVEVFRATNGEYPGASPEYVCLGEKQHYPAAGGWPEGVCYGSMDGAGIITYVGASVDEGLNDDLRGVVQTLPDATYRSNRVATGAFRGPIYLKRANNMADIIYFAEYQAGKTCPAGGVIYGSVEGGMAQCMIKIGEGWDGAP